MDRSGTVRSRDRAATGARSISAAPQLTKRAELNEQATRPAALLMPATRFMNSVLASKKLSLRFRAKQPHSKTVGIRLRCVTLNAHNIPTEESRSAR